MAQAQIVALVLSRLGFPRKQILSQGFECRRFIRECSWHQLPWKIKEISRIGQREKLSSNVVSTKAHSIPQDSAVEMDR